MTGNAEMYAALAELRKREESEAKLPPEEQIALLRRDIVLLQTALSRVLATLVEMVAVLRADTTTEKRRDRKSAPEV